MNANEKIAKITDTLLGYEDHGIFTVILTLEYGGGSAQGAGMYSLDQYDKETKQRYGTAAGMDFIIGIIRACGVDQWEKIKGRTVVAIMDRDDDWGGKVIGLKPLPTEGGKEFLFTDAFPEAVKA